MTNFKILFTLFGLLAIAWSETVTCDPPHNEGDTAYYFSREGGITAINSFCQSCADSGLVSCPESGAFEQRAESDGNGGGIIFTLETINDSSCPGLDFSQPGVEELCVQRLTSLVDDCQS